MQIKLDKLGITVEFVAGQTYELEFDGAAVLKGKYCFVPNIGFKPMFDTTIVCVKPLYVERNCTSISNLTDEEFAKEFSKAWSDVFGSLIFKKSGLLNECNDTTNTDEQEIKKLAKEMKAIFDKASDYHPDSWQELARKMYYPKKALDEALASEREYFGLLRQIGQHVGVTELPGYVETLKKYADECEEVCITQSKRLAKTLGYTETNLSFSQLCGCVKELSEENVKLKEQVKQARDLLSK